MEEALKEQQKIDESAEIDARAAMILDPDTGFGEKFAAVMTDLLAGKHTTQLEPESSGLYREPIDHGEDKDEPTKDF